MMLCFWRNCTFVAHRVRRLSAILSSQKKIPKTWPKGGFVGLQDRPWQYQGLPRETPHWRRESRRLYSMSYEYSTCKHYQAVSLGEIIANRPTCNCLLDQKTMGHNRSGPRKATALSMHLQFERNGSFSRSNRSCICSRRFSSFPASNLRFWVTVGCCHPVSDG